MVERVNSIIKGNDNKGFTLVEMIIVLVILAILAAIITPALLGYIDESREKQNIVDTRSVLQAVQSQLAKEYAKSNSIELDAECVIGGCNLKTGGKGNGDVDATNSKFAKDVLKLAGLSEEPWLLMIGIGSNYLEKGRDAAKDPEAINAQKSMTLHERYTVYYALYFKDKDSEPLYYYNGEWTKENPRAGDKDKAFSKFNVVVSGPLKGKRLQYYVLCYNTTQTNDTILGDSFWKKVKEQSGFKISDLWK